MRRVVVVDYDPGWPAMFERVRSIVWPAVSDLALSIEHVGSTSVPGLAAKPIVDITIVVKSQSDVVEGIKRLATIGYVHQGNLGIEGREAFDNPDGSVVHNLYLCPCESLALANHLAVRNYLRAHPDAAQEYGDLKKKLAAEFPHDIESYIYGKSEFILRVLRAAGLPSDRLQEIERATRAQGVNLRTAQASGSNRTDGRR